MKEYVFPFLILFTLHLNAQTTSEENKNYYRVAISNSHTAKPFASFSSLFYKDFHPGLEIGYGKNLKTVRKHQWLFEITMSYLFHRWVQHNIGFSVNGGYRYAFSSSWGGTARIGGGYQLSIPASRVFAITDNGLAAKGHVVRSQIAANFGLSADRRINSKGTKIFMEYQQKLQAPFIKEYVPLLPYNSLLLGLLIPVH